MFIAGVISWQDCSAPVKIRNMSPSGALLEAISLPQPGAEVRLRRGSLAAEGIIAWSGGDRCGVRFKASVVVRDWMAPSSNGQQHRVDAITERLKLGRPAVAAATVGSQAQRGASLTSRLHDATRLLDELSIDLANDPDVVLRHGRSLQLLDIVRQTLAAGVGDYARTR